jgi:hypothetical protein
VWYERPKAREPATGKQNATFWDLSRRRSREPSIAPIHRELVVINRQWHRPRNRSVGIALSYSVDAHSRTNDLDAARPPQVHVAVGADLILKSLCHVKRRRGTIHHAYRTRDAHLQSGGPPTPAQWWAHVVRSSRHLVTRKKRGPSSTTCSDSPGERLLSGSRNPAVFVTRIAKSPWDPRASPATLEGSLRPRPQLRARQAPPRMSLAGSHANRTRSVSSPRPVLVCLPLHIDEVGVKRVCFFLRHPGVDPRPARWSAESWHALRLVAAP